MRGTVPTLGGHPRRSAPFQQGLGGSCCVPRDSGRHTHPPHLEGVPGCCLTETGTGGPGPELLRRPSPRLPGGGLSPTRDLGRGRSRGPGSHQSPDLQAGRAVRAGDSEVPLLRDGPMPGLSNFLAASASPKPESRPPFSGQNKTVVFSRKRGGQGWRAWPLAGDSHSWGRGLPSLPHSPEGCGCRLPGQRACPRGAFPCSQPQSRGAGPQRTARRKPSNPPARPRVQTRGPASPPLACPRFLPRGTGCVDASPLGPAEPGLGLPGRTQSPQPPAPHLPGPGLPLPPRCVQPLPLQSLPHSEASWSPTPGHPGLPGHPGRECPCPLLPCLGPTVRVPLRIWPVEGP